MGGGTAGACTGGGTGAGNDAPLRQVKEHRGAGAVRWPAFAVLGLDSLASESPFPLTRKRKTRKTEQRHTKEPKKKLKPSMRLPSPPGPDYQNHSITHNSPTPGLRRLL
ncbi:hypothetical protein BT67DRAFT_28406 [Trichocladium antarcticum]|uniref:Uncharacterized protein n=1 Tax=Trichocladium antarcticum TaxID=1450529 RepID=A0AAN6UU22_9PEZI|nr:hypothetical protein BT67DRAFT_28406 [Trichocladium antarcticum]